MGLLTEFVDIDDSEVVDVLQALQLLCVSIKCGAFCVCVHLVLEKWDKIKGCKIENAQTN